MKTNQRLLGLASSVLATSACALPAVDVSKQANAPVVAKTGSGKTRLGRIAADGTDRVGALRLS